MLKNLYLGLNQTKVNLLKFFGKFIIGNYFNFMKILITGVAGFIGFHVAKELFKIKNLKFME